MTALKHKLHRSALSLLATLLCCGLAACKTYKLGHPAALPFATIYIEPVKNDSFAPQIQTLLSTQVREAVLRDGRIQLVADPQQADAVLQLRLTDYDRLASARRQDDTERAQTFDLSLRLQLSLYDPHNDRFYFQDRPVAARTTGYLNNPYAAVGAPATQGLIQSEFNAMPRLARELGQKAANELLSTW